MTIGMIVAIPQEIDALFRSIGAPGGTEESAGYTVACYELNGHRIYVAGSGAGEIAAASTTQFLITKYGAELIVNFGVCGGLTDEMGVHRTVVVEKAVHYDYDASAFYRNSPAQYPDYPDIYIPASEELVSLALRTEPTLHSAICASADKFVAEADDKRRLHMLYGATICEMEAAGILLTARRNKVPALLIKGVSDSVTGGAEEFAEMVHSSAEVCVRVLLNILKAI